MVRHKYKLYSFDIFDTLITRQVATPKGIFALMQSNISNNIEFSDDFKNNFYNIRIKSERNARENKFKTQNTKEVNLYEIYADIQKNYSLSDEQIQILTDLEIETEINNIIPIEKNIKTVLNLKKSGAKVVLISDMYLPSSVIKRILSNVSQELNELPLYLSNEHNAAKCEGTLYKKIKDIESVSYHSWLHCGDNLFADIKNAKSLGIKTKHLPLPKFFNYEQDGIEFCGQNPIYQKLIGCARICRFKKVKKHQDKYNFGASYTAPIIFNYINFIIENCIKNNYKTLYFIARDGYIPKLVADIIIRNRNLNITTKYLYGSRYAWRIPSEENYNFLTNAMLNEYCNRLNLELLAWRLHVSTEELNKYLNIENVKATFTDKERIRIKNLIQNDKIIKQFIINANKERRELLQDYLKQEIDCTDKNIVMVDVNGSGVTQDILWGYIKTSNEMQLNIFYLSTSYAAEKAENSHKNAFCTEAKSHYNYFELLTRALDGQTIGYKRENKKIVPICEACVKDNLVNWGFNEYLEGIENYANIASSSNLNIPDVNFCYFYHDYMTSKCTCQIADILGELPFGNIGNEANINKVAPKLSLRELIKIKLKGIKLVQISEFPHISFARERSLSKFIKKKIVNINKMPLFFFEWKLLYFLHKYKNDKVVLWGASLFLENCIKKYKIKNSNILGVVDLNENRQGCHIGSYKIISPDKIKELHPDCLLMTIQNLSRIHYFNIENYLHKNNIQLELLPNIFEQ